MYQTPHLTLRGAMLSDATAILGLYNNPLVAPWITTAFPNPHHESEKPNLLRLTEEALMGCVVAEKTTGTFVGLAGLLPWRVARETKNRNVEIYVALLPEFWGKGYAFEAVMHLVEHAFWEMGMHKVSLVLIDGNGRAMKLYERLGFVHEGRDRKAIWSQGRWRDIIRMGVFENEWREWKAKNLEPPQKEPESTS